ncbi:MAG: PQQ-like beta-propeller repeat protein [Planctomycetota bacterium]|nr:PQQ-like beta-propeller repeat protein [Planctomycetota bacterium]
MNSPPDPVRPRAAVQAFLIATASIVAGHPALAAEPGADAEVVFHRPPKPLASGVVTHDWTSFLGPTHDGICPETKLLKSWPAGGPALVWEMKAGEGYASPAIQRQVLVYFHRIGNSERVDCVHAETGRRFWKYEYPTAYRDRYGFSNGPRASPVIDGTRVFTFGAEGKLHCLDLATGRVIWENDTTGTFGVPANFFGVGSSPLVEGDLLIVQVGATGGPCVVAFDKADGKVVWKAGDRWLASYASPVPAVVHGQRRVLVFAGGDARPPTGGLLSIDPANGAIDARFPFRGRKYESVNASNPVFAGNQVFLSTSYATGGAALNLKAGGGSAVAWKSDDLGTHFATPILKDGFLYGIGGMQNNVALVCLDWKTGHKQWRHIPEWTEDVLRNGKKEAATFSTGAGAMIHADGHFLLLGEFGHMLWADLTPQGYRELQRVRLFDARQTWCPPVICRGLLYISQNRPDRSGGTGPRLLCYDFRNAR